MIRHVIAGVPLERDSIMHRKTASHVYIHPHSGHSFGPQRNAGALDQRPGHGAGRHQRDNRGAEK
jgi:hypothetical protein